MTYIAERISDFFKDKLNQASSVGIGTTITVNMVQLNIYIETIILLVSLLFLVERYLDYRKNRNKPKPPKS